MPPLRERKEDIKELVHYFIQKYNKKLGKTIKGITTDGLKRLEEYTWPGNVRELENVIQRSIVFCTGDYLSILCFEGLGAQEGLQKSCASVEEAIQNLVDLAFKYGCNERFQDMLNMIEKGMVKRALELTKGNQVQAAKLLGISRNTLRKKLEG